MHQFYYSPTKPGPCSLTVLQNKSVILFQEFLNSEWQNLLVNFGPLTFPSLTSSELQFCSALLMHNPISQKHHE